MFTTVGKVLAVIGFTLSLLMITVSVLTTYHGISDTFANMSTGEAIDTGIMLLVGSTALGILAEISQRLGKCPASL
ncbi:hypothetical protein [Ruegeria arenilitoris]|uniref:hypothetical protein n=1 Tax=Ruegeria arenilitoris TaxID=1173585 RepID=UPI00147FFF40|nr:hypothetical protein [Ruegeria arenilitoris]